VEDETEAALRDGKKENASWRLYDRKAPAISCATRNIDANALGWATVKYRFAIKD
jgi:hypothetical protein